MQTARVVLAHTSGDILRRSLLAALSQPSLNEHAAGFLSLPPQPHLVLTCHASAALLRGLSCTARGGASSALA